MKIIRSELRVLGELSDMQCGFTSSHTLDEERIRIRLQNSFEEPFLVDSENVASRV